MKQPTIDIFHEAKKDYLDSMAFINKFKRYWGTTIVDGHEVFVERNYYYPSMSDSMVKFLKLIGSYEKIRSGKMQGISSAWLYLNPAKSTIGSKQTDAIAADLSQVGVFEGSVTIGAMDASGISDITSSTSDTEAFIDEIKSKYSTLWSKYVINSSLDGDGFKDTLLRYALGSQDLSYEVIKVENSYTEYQVKVSGTTSQYRTVLGKGYTITLKITQAFLSSTDDIIVAIWNDLNSEGRNADITKTSMGRVYASPTVSGNDDEDYNYSYTVSGVAPGDVSLWVQSGGKWYLKTSSVGWGSLIKRKNRIKFLGSLIDSGYTKKKVKWYKKLIAIIVFVVVVYFSYGNAPLAKGVSAAVYIVANAAFAISMGALALQFTQMAMTAWGDTSGAAGVGAFSKMIAPITKLAGIISFVSSMYSAVTNMAKEGAMEAGRQAAAQQAAGEMTTYSAKEFSKVAAEKALEIATKSIGSTIKYAIKGVAQSIKVQAASLTSGIGMSTLRVGVKALEVAGKLVQMNKTKEIKKMENRVGALQKELQEAEEVNNSSNNMNIAERALINSMFNPMNADAASQYEVDTEYNPEPSKLRIGNIHKYRYIMNPGDYRYHR